MSELCRLRSRILAYLCDVHTRVPDFRSSTRETVSMHPHRLSAQLVVLIDLAELTEIYVFEGTNGET